VMKELRQTTGCSAIVYVQTCAAEKRRRRKRGLLEDPPKRIIINPLVCEGCGDCSVQSNCVSIEPLETSFGRKRQINQSSCNKDYSCVNGFCPSFITVNGGELRSKAIGFSADLNDIPLPQSNLTLEQPYNIAITGVGGTGVLTIGALLGMAAHIEGKASMILDMSGLAQKGGSVISHVRISHDPGQVTSPRIVNGRADLLIAADSVVASSKDGISLCAPDHTKAIVNTHLMPVADFVTNRDFDFKQKLVEASIKKNVLDTDDFKNFTDIAERVIGDSIATNILMLGYALQQGYLPVSYQSILRAIEINGVAIEANKKSFNLGRKIAVNPEIVSELVNAEQTQTRLEDMSLEALIDHRSEFLTDYQNSGLAKRYRQLVERVKLKVDKDNLDPKLIRSVAENYAKLLAYKDEYEVARLYTNGAFEKQLKEQFKGDFEIKLNLAPPIFPGTQPNGRPKKREFGPWILKSFGLLTKLKSLRGTPFDVFGYHQDRKAERELIKDYENLVNDLVAQVNQSNQAIILELFSIPKNIRGFGPVKAQSIINARQCEKELLEKLNSIATIEPHTSLAA